MKRLSIFFVFVLVIATALFTAAADKSIAADKSVPQTAYKAELSGQKEVPEVQPAPGETKPTGEAIFQFGGKETGAPGGVAPGPRYRGVEPGPPDPSVSFYYKGIIDRPVSVSAKGGSAAGGTAGDVLHYKLNVKDIENVTAAHLHMGKKGTPTAEAPVIVPLYAGPEKTGTFSGLLAEGTITSKDLKGPMSGKTIQDLAKLMEKGEVFVNVHTAQHPVGEIRGEVAPK